MPNLHSTKVFGDLIVSGESNIDNLTLTGTIQNGSIWINDGTNINNYNENIRLFAPSNGAAVIAFNASGTGGMPVTSVLGFSDRLESRVGNDWKTRMYSYGLHVNRDLHVSGGTGGNYGNRIIVGNTDTSFTLQDGNERPTIHAHGAYPVLSLNHTVTSNASHGPTVQFTANGTGNQFVIGMTGNGTRLDFGTGSGNWNPHNGIANYSGTTAMSINTSGNVGIRTLSPSYTLDVNGSARVASNLTHNSDIVATNYGIGLVGLYSSYRYQNVFSMGAAYRLSADGTSPGNLYGIAWSHTNTGGQTKSGLGHQALFMDNGVTYSAVGNGIWTAGNITLGNNGVQLRYNSSDDSLEFIF